MKRVIAFFVILAALLMYSHGKLHAQEKMNPTVEQKGNMFIQKSSTKGGYAKTEYVYQDATGQIDTLYVSSRGAYFVFKLSKSGKIYRKYIPEVTKRLNPDYYNQRNNDKKPN